MNGRNSNTKRLHAKMSCVAKAGGDMFVDGFHYLALFATGGSIVWAAVLAFAHMVDQGGASIEDILLLFIYLKLGAMVGIYFKINHMPVRYPDLHRHDRVDADDDRAYPGSAHSRLGNFDDFRDDIAACIDSPGNALWFFSPAGYAFTRGE